jgi:hypothetical protein
MGQKEIAIIEPSKRFLSDVCYYTIRLSNALSEFAEVKAILFRNMLPRRFFQLTDLSNHNYNDLSLKSFKSFAKIFAEINRFQQRETTAMPKDF